MSSDILSTLKEIDPALLTDVVRQDQRSPTFELLNWAVEPISHARILTTTGGLFRFSGDGHDADGVKLWSIVLKIIINPQRAEEDITSVFYWKRELLALDSGLLESLPNAVRVPRFYGMTEHENSVWLWMEYVVESTERRWSLEHFRRAAHQFGRLGGAYLSGTPLPDAPWLSSPSVRSAFLDGGFWMTFINPDADRNAWQHPVVHSAFGEPLRSYALGVLAEKDRFLATLDRLPQVFCHKDLNRRNLMFCTTAEGHEEVVALDWAWCGNGAIGLDAGWIVIDALFFIDFEPTRAAELEAAVLDGYLAGLRAAGWSGDERLARLGYLIPLTFWMALLPGWAAMMLGDELDADTMPMYGRNAADVLTAWLTAEEFFTPRVDETRSLMRELNIG